MDEAWFADADMWDHHEGVVGLLKRFETWMIENAESLRVGKPSKAARTGHKQLMADLRATRANTGPMAKREAITQLMAKLKLKSLAK